MKPVRHEVRLSRLSELREIVVARVGLPVRVQVADLVDVDRQLVLEVHLVHMRDAVLEPRTDVARAVEHVLALKLEVVDHSLMALLLLLEAEVPHVINIPCNS